MTPTHQLDVVAGLMGVAARKASAALGAFLAAASLMDSAGAATTAAAGGTAKPQSGHVTPQRARSLFFLHCAGCHRFDGSGAPRSGVPSMIDTLGYFQRTAAGRAFLVQVPGARNAGVTDAELAAITNWQLQTFSKATLPADFKPYTTEEVAGLRHLPLFDVIGTRAALMSENPALSGQAGADAAAAKAPAPAP